MDALYHLLWALPLLVSASYFFWLKWDGRTTSNKTTTEVQRQTGARDYRSFSEVVRDSQQRTSTSSNPSTSNSHATTNNTNNLQQNTSSSQGNSKPTYSEVTKGSPCRALKSKSRAPSEADSGSRREAQVDITSERMKIKIQFDSLSKEKQKNIIKESLDSIPHPATQETYLKKNKILPRYQVDLHGLSEEEALEVVKICLRTLKKENCDEAYIITGKGINSVNGIPILKRAVRKYLKSNKYNFSALTGFGGSGGFKVKLTCNR